MQAIVTRLPGEPIVIVELHSTDTPESEIREVAQAIAALIKGEKGPIYRINDFTHVQIPLTTMIMGLGREMHGTPGSLSDPRIKPIFVSTSKIVALGIRSAYRGRYGRLDILLFATLEDALAHIRAEHATDTDA